MIIDGPLSEERQRKSRFYNLVFNFFNGISYMCLGETVVILLAVKMGCADHIIAALGAMVYLGYIMLPAGKLTAARYGAVRSQVVFWYMRNLSALLVAVAPWLQQHVSQTVAEVAILLGGFLFYGFRSAGIVLIQPLVGGMTNSSNRTSFLAFASALAYLPMVLTLAVISLVSSRYEGVRTLTGVIVTGALFGFCSAQILKGIDESSSLRESARRPFWPQFHEIIRMSSFRKMIMTNMIMNLTTIMIIPASLLTLKRGYGMSDHQALIFTIIQQSFCVITSMLSVRLSQRLGPRKMLIGAFLLYIGVCLLWGFSPAQKQAAFLWMPFMLIGIAHLTQVNATTYYFLQTVPVRLQVVGAIIQSVLAGAGSAVLGVLLSGSLLQVIAVHLADRPPLERYQLYFLCAVAILPGGICACLRLTPLPEEKRRRIGPKWLPL